MSNTSNGKPNGSIKARTVLGIASSKMPISGLLVLRKAGFSVIRRVNFISSQIEKIILFGSAGCILQTSLPDGRQKNATYKTFCI
jgi:hypothetical protein